MTSQPSFHRLVITTAALLLMAGMVPGIPAEAGPARMIKDINQVQHPVELRLDRGQETPQFVQVGPVTFFVADFGTTSDVPTSGWELWKATGAEGTPELVADINPGPDPSDPTSLTPVGGTLFFAADDGIHGRELWKSDGTAVGTTMVKDINPDSASFFAQRWVGSLFAAVGDTLFFSGHDGVNGTGLWKSDGTEEGTMLVKDIDPVAGAGNPRAVEFSVVGNTLFFSADDGTTIGLWKSDGTEAGTLMVKAIDPDDLTALGGTLFFSADDGVHGRELWKSDGTAVGTMMVKDIDANGSGIIAWSSFSSAFIAVGDQLFIEARGGSHGVFEYELWKSDGTEAGTVPVTDLNDEVIVGFKFVTGGDFTAANGFLFFTKGSFGATELWKTDGAPGGTGKVADLPSIFDTPVTAGNQVFFPGFDTIHGIELWTSDGTDAGTMLVEDINPGVNDGVRWWVTDRPTQVGDELIFWADDGVARERKLWRSDGTAEGTVPVETAALADGHSRIFHLTAVGDSVFFTAYDGINGTDLWKSDGTPEGTMPVKDVPFSSFYDPFFTAVHDTLFFRGFSSLWKSDGTGAGTVLVNDSPLGYFNPFGLTALDGTLFFIHYAPLGLWKSDGTEAGTVQVKQQVHFDINRDRLVAAGDTLFFSAAQQYIHSSRFLWKSDGTEAGTVPVMDPLACPSNLASLTTVNDMVFFEGFSEQAWSWGLWRSDGTAEGTILIEELESRFSVGGLIAVNETLSYSKDDPIRGWELWKSDGTVAGTVLVKTIETGFRTVVGDTLFFAGDDAIAGPGLWRSDGTEAGTELVRAVLPILVYAFSPIYPFSSDYVSAPPLTGNPRGLLFAADEDGAGIEPWGSNGEESGTRQIQDINPGAFSSNPHSFTVAGSRAFFVADDGTHGAELWGGRAAILMRNPEAAARDLAAEVRALGLDRGIETSLTAKLDQVARMLGDPKHHDSPAALQLVEAFMHEALAQRGGAILNEDADDLLDFGEEIVELLSEEIEE